jgi:pyruvate,water dikinase
MTAVSEMLWIDRLEDEHRDAVGAKVFRLGEIARLGVSVPRGFAVPALGLSTFLQASGLDGTVRAALADLDPADDAAIEVAASRIERGFAVAAFPADLGAAIADAYRQLCLATEAEVSVAVRSSGAREDGATASFAGQFVTVLGVRGIENVLDAVKECWASAFSARVLAYSLRNGLSPLDPALAVGIMSLVSARSAGVAFSVHPTTGSRSRVVVEGSWGWGEAVVQGLVTPDYAELDKADGRVLTYRVADKHTVSLFDADAGRVVERAMPEHLVATRVLSEAELIGLHRAVVAIEKKYGAPVDVEWAIDDRFADDECVVIVQARPVTTLREPAPLTWDPFANAMRFGLAGGATHG